MSINFLKWREVEVAAKNNGPYFAVGIRSARLPTTMSPTTLKLEKLLHCLSSFLFLPNFQTVVFHCRG